jgi:ATP-dependent Clp protease adaptor protein ClpS
MAETKTQNKSRTKLKYPSRFNVVFHNDDYTPMEFVIHLLIEVFNKNIEQAKEITLAIHTEGRAIAATYSLEIAQQKTHESSLLSSHAGHPLIVSYEQV